jgi:hypothetical protein
MSKQGLVGSILGFVMLAFPAAAQSGMGTGGYHPPGAITNTGFGYGLLNSIQGYPLPSGRSGFGGGVNNLTPLGGIYPYLMLPAYYPPPIPQTLVVPSPSSPPVIFHQTIVTGANGQTAPAQAEQTVTSFTAPPASTDFTSPRPAPAAASLGSSYGPSNLYLIAFKGGSVESALAYWYEDGKVDFVSPDHTIHTVAVSQLDPKLSERINKERGVDFHSPEP